MSKIAVVTGAGRGLGRAIAERLARRGLSVLVTDIDGEAAAMTAKSCGETSWSAQQDVRDPESHRAVVRDATSRGELTVWINNAGVLVVGETWRLAEADVRRMVEINLLGVMWGCHAAVPHIGDGGHIINIASISGLTPTPGLAVYGATKHAVIGYSLSLAGELRAAGKRIQVSALAPDAIANEMTKAVSHDASSGLLFSGSMLSVEGVADAAIELLDTPRLVRTIPAYRAMAIHLLRPFPSIGLPLLQQVAKLGRWRKRD